MNMMYGIKHCDTIKKAKKWLDTNAIEYEFNDYREQGVNPILLRSWVNELGWEVLLNKRSTTWRNLPDETKQNMSETLALHVMEDQPTIIKRPILVTATKPLVGFKESDYQKVFL